MDGFVKNALVPLLLRVGLAVIFLYHGLEKVSRSHQWGAAWNNDVPITLQVATSWAELACGLALLVGYLTRLAAAGGVAILAGAVYLVHGKYGFGLQTGDAYRQGYEYKLALLVMCTAVLLLGSGTLALDWCVRARAAKPFPSRKDSPGDGREPAADSEAVLAGQS
jgi:putative oxidoreductase